MSPELIVSIIAVYFLVLIIIAYYTSRGADTETFFIANRNAPWYLVAFGMIGASISGVTFISVPGAVGADKFSYFQMVLGYLPGYAFIALVLMPLYYRLNLISIYTYLDERFGLNAYRTGAFFFLLSRTVGAAFRLFLAALVLHLGIFAPLGIPFWLNVIITIGLIWVYTFKGGIKTIIWTDTLQTFFLVSALIISVVLIASQLNLGIGELITTVQNSDYSQIFFWEMNDKKNFFKQFLAGMFIAITMTGLDQDLMQKNLSCKNLKEAQKNMFSFCVVLVFVNLLFLTLGALLYMYAQEKGIALPERSDELYPLLALKLNSFGTLAAVFFLLGITASTYASADSALASLTTSFCIDFLDFKNRKEEQRQKIKFWVHLGFSFLLFLVILIFKALNDESVINAVFKAAGYTYGPLLGLFAFGLFTRWKVRDKFVPYICLASPILCYLLNLYSADLFGGYKFGNEMLLINGGLTFLGLLALKK
ncbi:sodium:solute symporter [Thermoflexibacter ruber]|uniref:Transporter, SSS family n=1 Tax=Thermoflexibacter ruber TaxID=1003 RepID=A0A1I2JKM2_9BACT|nr:sodium:solute symporter [Thermoflexibacter ruber]SFF53366.1 transporter, SSS family [Thermoflexibacter ruber]